MITKRLKNLWKLGTLAIVRQLYFLGRNWYELIYSPYLTLKEIREKADKSQMVLIGITSLLPIVVYGGGRIIYDLIRYQQILWFTGKVFMAVVIIQILILSYLSYWVLQVLKREE